MGKVRETAAYSAKTIKMYDLQNFYLPVHKIKDKHS